MPNPNSSIDSNILKVAMKAAYISENEEQFLRKKKNKVFFLIIVMTAYFQILINELKRTKLLTLQIKNSEYYPIF